MTECECVEGYNFTAKELKEHLEWRKQTPLRFLNLQLREHILSGACKFEVSE